MNVDANIKKIIYDEFARMKNFKKDSSEFNNVVDWLDRILKLPWNVEKEDNCDIKIKYNLDTGFRINKINFNLDVAICASLIDILWAIIMTFINNRRINNEKRRKTEC